MSQKINEQDKFLRFLNDFIIFLRNEKKKRVLTNTESYLLSKAKRIHTEIIVFSNVLQSEIISGYYRRKQK